MFAPALAVACGPKATASARPGGLMIRVSMKSPSRVKKPLNPFDPTVTQQTAVELRAMVVISTAGGL